MPERHEWEWLKQPPNESTKAEQDAHQLRNLRRWIDSIEPSRSDTNAADADVVPKPRRLSRLERREQLRQIQSNSSTGRTLPTVRLQSSLEFQQSVESQPLIEPEPLPEPEQGVQFQAVPESGHEMKSVHEVKSSRPGSLSPRNSLPEQPTHHNGAKKMAKKKDDYRDHLKQEFNTLFENLTLQPQQRHYLKSRWLDQVLWMEGRAGKARNMHYRLRLTTIIGGVIIPALVSLNFTGNDNIQFKQTIAASTFVLSQAVAICAATEQFFNYGDRWRHYRRSVESLKTQGWQFFELTGPYETSKTHEQAFSVFANQVEQILQHDVEIYSTQVAQAKQNDKQEDDQKANAASPAPVNGRFPTSAADVIRQP